MMKLHSLQGTIEDDDARAFESQTNSLAVNNLGKMMSLAISKLHKIRVMTRFFFNICRLTTFKICHKT